MGCGLILPAFLAAFALSGCTGSGETAKGPPGGYVLDSGVEGSSPDGAGGTTGCKPATCAQLGADCGVAPDGCGSVISCGACASGKTCGGAGPNRCGSMTCTPHNCAQAGAECGYASDGCGNAIHCGSCPGWSVCGANGKQNQCGCAVKSCGPLSVECGTAPDGCGSTIDCGSCPAGKTCGAAGPNKCGTGTCTPSTCSAQGKDCGWVSDLCASALSCGTCQSPMTCGGAGVASVCGAPPPSCSMWISPGTGSTATVFTAQWSASSDATSCTSSVDSAAPVAQTCSGTVPFEGAAVGVGSHTVHLFAQGPTGTGECSSSFLVVDQPSCQGTITPSLGGASTTFHASWSSANSVFCFYQIDGAGSTAIACSGEQDFSGAAFAVGAHTLTFQVSNLGATGTCNIPFEIVGPATCAISVSPAKGEVATSFVATWSTTGGADSCSFAIDGGPANSTACSGTVPFLGSDFGLGKHTISFGATGPGGSGTCQTQFEVGVIPTCSISIDPSQGGLSTQFSATWNATGATACAWGLDAPASNSVDCVGSAPFTGQGVGAGDHTIHFQSSNAFATTDCSDSFSVSGP